MDAASIAALVVALSTALGALGFRYRSRSSEKAEDAETTKTYAESSAAVATAARQLLEPLQEQLKEVRARLSVVEADHERARAELDQTKRELREDRVNSKAIQDLAVAEIARLRDLRDADIEECRHEISLIRAEQDDQIAELQQEIARLRE